MAGLSNVLWVIDLNRQSLDRIIPGIRVKAWRSMFRGNGWKVVDAKYGKRLQAAFRQPNGELLRTAIDRHVERGVPAPASRLVGDPSGVAAADERVP